MTIEDKYAHAVIQLLAITVLADKRILGDEIKAFTDTILWLQSENILHSDYSEAQLLLWYEMNKDGLQQALKNDRFENWLACCLTRLSDFPHKAHLFEAVLLISRSDNELHVSEKALTMLLAKHWKHEVWLQEQLK